MRCCSLIHTCVGLNLVWCMWLFVWISYIQADRLLSCVTLNFNPVFLPAVKSTSTSILLFIHLFLLSAKYFQMLCLIWKMCFSDVFLANSKPFIWIKSIFPLYPLSIFRTSLKIWTNTLSGGLIFWSAMQSLLRRGWKLSKTTPSSYGTCTHTHKHTNNS